MSALKNPVPSQAPVTAPSLAPEPPVRPRWSAAKFLILLILVAGAGWAVYQLAKKPEASGSGTVQASVPTAAVSSGTLTQTLRVSGQTSARNFANIVAPVLVGPDSGRALLLMRLVPSGTRVGQGHQLAMIDGQSLRDHIDDVNDQVVQAQADVRKRQAEQAISWFNLQQTLTVAKANLEKARLEYSAAEVRTGVDQELLKLAVEEAEARYKQLLSDEAHTKASHAAEIRNLEITLKRHTRHRDNHASDLHRFEIKSPMNGLTVLSSLHRGGEMQQLREGDQVAPGQPIMRVVDTSSMQVEARISQAESSQLRIGQTAVIRLDAFPGLEFKGRVYSIGALASSGGRQGYYVRTVPVRVTIDGADPRLIPDLSASADIEIEREEAAVIVPISALFEEAGKKMVNVRVGTGFQKREVALGLANASQVTVRSGLSAGDVVQIR